MKLSLILTLFVASLTNANLLPTPGSGDCGISLSPSRLIGRNETNLDEFPWVALLGYERKNDNSTLFACSGALINSRYVLTAAHCISPYSNLKFVRLGEWDLDTTSDCDYDGCADPVQDIAVEKVIKHSEYIGGLTNKQNDIALLRLEKSVAFNDFVKPICLPVKNQHEDATNLIFAGWSRSFGERRNKKSKTEFKSVDQETCKQVYAKHSHELSDSQFCAVGEPGKDTCAGDGGGPLAAIRDGYFYLAGLVSYGPSNCNNSEVPGVYTRVSSFLEWIEENFKE